MRDARKIIFPGANGDPWWDHTQLLKQVKELLEIHKELHPGKVALLVFDCSSAHEALPPDALKAFEMNKSDGGKQRRQQDTVIPQSNPDPSCHGKTQKMTLSVVLPRLGAARLWLGLKWLFLIGMSQAKPSHAKAVAFGAARLKAA